MKKQIFTAVALLCALAAQAQDPQATGLENITRYTPAAGTAPLRSEFVSFGVREQAEKGFMMSNPHYIPLDFSKSGEVAIDVPFEWLDREIFLQAQGKAPYYITVNGRRVGFCGDPVTPAQFNITPHLTTGKNTIGRQDAGLASPLEKPGTLNPECFIFSQGKVRIADFIVGNRPEPGTDYYWFDLKVIVANGYNSAETVTVGYDIYTPGLSSKLQLYDMADATLGGQGCDTVSFSTHLYRVLDNLWSAGSPKLYSVMLTLKHNGKIIEYIHLKMGVGTTAMKPGIVIRNGKEEAIVAAGYNAAVDDSKTKKDILALKKHGVNTLCPDYPQPSWFYFLCDWMGMYVIDRANINAEKDAADRRAGGNPGNDPAFQTEYAYRTEAMFRRARNHTCIVARSLGGATGNGYNMYLTYKLLKSLDPAGTVVFDNAGGEWNSDLPPIVVTPAAEILARPLPQPAKPAAKPGAKPGVKPAAKPDAKK